MDLPSYAPKLLPFESVADIHVNPSLSHAESNTQDGPYRNFPSDEQWDFIRPAFIDCYITRDQPLHVAMKTMAHRFNFQASVKQFKGKIESWRLRKKLTAAARDKLSKLAEQCYRTGQPLPLYGLDGNPYQWHKARRSDLINNRRVAVWKHFDLSREMVKSTTTRTLGATQQPVDMALAVSAHLLASLGPAQPRMCQATPPPDEHRSNEFVLLPITQFIPVSEMEVGMQDPIGFSALYHNVVERESANDCLYTSKLKLLLSS